MAEIVQSSNGVVHWLIRGEYGCGGAWMPSPTLPRAEVDEVTEGLVLKIAKENNWLKVHMCRKCFPRFAEIPLGHHMWKEPGTNASLLPRAGE